MTTDVTFKAAPVLAIASGKRWLALALALHFLLGGYYLVLLPLWGAVPDEPLHYSRIKYEAEIGGWPLITDPRHWGEPLAVYAFTADPVGTSQHGPFYYTLAVPLFQLTRGLTVEDQMYALRGYSLLLGALALPLAWGVLRRCFPGAPTLAGLGLLCVALAPHRLMLSAVIYNDIACVLTAFLALYVLVKVAQEGASSGADAAAMRRVAWGWFWVGVALGVAYLAKRVALIFLPAVLYLLWASLRSSGWSWARFVRHGLLFWAGMLLTCGWWVLRDYLLYGELFPVEPSFARLTWLQFLVNMPPEQYGTAFWFVLRGFWLSLWSQVGWLPFDGPGLWPVFTYAVHVGLLLVTLLTLIGLAAGWRGQWRSHLMASGTSPRLVAVAFLLLLAGMFYGALHFVLLTSLHGNEETGKHAQAIFVPLVGLWLLASRQLLGPARASWGAGALAGLLLAFNLGSMLWLSTSLIPRYAPPTPPLARLPVQDLPSGRAPGMWHRYVVPGVTQEAPAVTRPASAREPVTRTNPAGTFTQ